MEDSVFTKIIKGELPSYKVYEDDKTITILTINPKIAGHTLVIPKKQVEFLWDLEDEDYEAVMRTAKKVAQRIREVLKPPYVGEIVEGVEVPHAHVHVFPFTTIEESRRVPDPDAEPDHPALAAMAKKLAF